jgi:hypothetical protein
MPNMTQSSAYNDAIAPERSGGTDRVVNGSR